MASAVTVRTSTPADGPGCDAVVATLPYHFGNERGRADCAEAVRKQHGLVADRGGRVVGFLTFASHGPSTEITWMAVRADQRRSGIGTQLIRRLEDDVRERGARFVFVLTLGPSVPDDVEDGHEGTRRFYEAVGFTPLREFDLRSWDDPAALVLVRHLEDAKL